MGIFKISCDEATTICDKSQYKESSFLDKVKLSIHFFRCKYCKCYSKQNSFLTEMYKKHAATKEKRPVTLCDEDKCKLEEALKQKLKEN